MANFASAQIPVEQGEDPGQEPENVQTLDDEGNRIQHQSGSGPGDDQGGSEEGPTEGDDDLILGKFKSQEDLAKAYQELEKKMSSGEGDSDEVSEDASKSDEGSGEGETPSEQPGTLEEAMEAASEAYAENGEVSAEDYARFEALGVPKEMVDSYLAGQQALAEKGASAIMEAAGGQEAFETMSKWAQNGGLSADEIASFNRTMESGDEGAAKMAMRGLRAAYEAAEGTTGKTITGDQNNRQSGVQPFGSVEEMVEAMQSRKYEHDPAFRKQVEERVAVSPF